MSKQYTLMIPMDYPGAEISKNHLWKGGNRRYGKNDTAKEWKRSLADSIRMVLLKDGIRSPRPPVSVQVGGRFIDAHNAVDLHNLGELTCDAVEAGTGINDRHYAFSTLAPTFDDTRMPAIWVTITVTVGE